MRKKQPDHTEPAILSAWALFFVFVLISGRLPLYINPKFAVLPLIGALILGAMAWVLRHGKISSGGARRHDWSALPWFLMPVVMSLIIAPAGMGAFVAGSRGSAALNSGSGNSSISLDLSGQTGYRNLTILDLVEAGNLKSGKVCVDGQLLPAGSGLAADECLIAHYRMVCCVADVQPVVVILKYPEGYKPAKNQWVRVCGTATRERQGVVLVADSIQPIGAPNPPYLY